MSDATDSSTTSGFPDANNTTTTNPISKTTLTNSGNTLRTSLGGNVKTKRLEAAQAIVATGRQSFKDSDEEEADKEESDSEQAETPQDDEQILSGGSKKLNEYTRVHETQKRLAESIYERSKFIPFRLSSEERQYLRLLEGALNVSEYTDKIDIIHMGSKSKRIAAQIEEICALLSGLLVTVDYDVGKTLITGKDFKENESYFQDIFEVGRRFKIMNPEKLRTEYGKLIYMVQDAMSQEVQYLLNFNPKKEIRTVFSFLEEKGALDLLSDELLLAATKEIVDDGTKTRQQLKQEAEDKRQAAEKLVQKYSTPRSAIANSPTKKLKSLRIDVNEDPSGPFSKGDDSEEDEDSSDDESNNSAKSSVLNNHNHSSKKEKKRERSSQITGEEIRRCLRSIGDNNSFLRSNCDSLDRLIFYLTEYFGGKGVSNTKWSLAITAGRGGARLSHRHEYQYEYVYQSLTLWKEIQLDMFKLWYLAEKDLLSETSSYRLMNTGQGLNRLQRAPNIGGAMSKILSNTQKQLTCGWVGSSVVHLGDTNVPNALMFIDKYTQVPRIINPIIITISEISRVAQDEGIRMYIENTFGSIEDAKKAILQDFFRHGFDGSGADNFFEAGSCIDGRLTSAWNWCSKISEKLYYPLFRLTGFVGFDGDFQR